jgi:hypothetical protein
MAIVDETHDDDRSVPERLCVADPCVRDGRR